MHLEAVGLGKQLATSLTFVRKDSCVFSGVSLQTAVVNKRCFTVFTLVRSLASVPSPVFPQGACHESWKQLIKHCACTQASFPGFYLFLSWKGTLSTKEEKRPWERGYMYPSRLLRSSKNIQSKIIRRVPRKQCTYSGPGISKQNYASLGLVSAK